MATPQLAGTAATPIARLARLVTEILSPAVLVAALLLAVAWHAAQSAVQALVLGLIGAAAASFIPITYIVKGVRRGRWTNHHVPIREHRTLPLLVCLASTLAGAVALWAVSAPREFVALVVSMAAALMVTWPVTVLLRWKLSVHMLVASGTVAALTVVYGVAALALSPIAVAVGWSRIRLRDHSLAEVVSGAVLGTIASAALFPALAY